MSFFSTSLDFSVYTKYYTLSAEMKKAEDDYLKAAEAEYKKLTATSEKGQPLVNTKPEFKLPADGQTPKKQLNPMNKDMKKTLPKTSAVK